jgi:hypothetical protein
MADYGIKISQDGYDVKTAQDNQLIFSTKFGSYNSMCIALQGTLQQTISAYSNYEFTITHGLSFAPFALGYYTNDKNSNGYWRWIPTSGIDFLLSDDYCNIYFYKMDSTYVKFKFYNNYSSSLTVTLRYYIFNMPL